MGQQKLDHAYQFSETANSKETLEHKCMKKQKVELGKQEKLIGAIKTQLQELRQELEFLRDISSEMIDMHEIREAAKATAKATGKEDLGGAKRR